MSEPGWNHHEHEASEPEITEDFDLNAASENDGDTGNEGSGYAVDEAAVEAHASGSASRTEGDDDEDAEGEAEEAGESTGSKVAAGAKRLVGAAGSASAFALDKVRQMSPRTRISVASGLSALALGGALLSRGTPPKVEIPKPDAAASATDKPNDAKTKSDAKAEKPEVAEAEKAKPAEGEKPAVAEAANAEPPMPSLADTSAPKLADGDDKAVEPGLPAIDPSANHAPPLSPIADAATVLAANTSKDKAPDPAVPSPTPSAGDGGAPSPAPSAGDPPLPELPPTAAPTDAKAADAKMPPSPTPTEPALPKPDAAPAPAPVPAPSPSDAPNPNPPPATDAAPALTPAADAPKPGEAPKDQKPDPAPPSGTAPAPQPPAAEPKPEPMPMPPPAAAPAIAATPTPEKPADPALPKPDAAPAPAPTEPKVDMPGLPPVASATTPAPAPAATPAPAPTQPSAPLDIAGGDSAKPKAEPAMPAVPPAPPNELSPATIAAGAAGLAGGAAAAAAGGAAIVPQHDSAPPKTESIESGYVRIKNAGASQQRDLNASNDPRGDEGFVYSTPDADSSAVSPSPIDSELAADTNRRFEVDAPPPKTKGRTIQAKAEPEESRVEATLHTVEKKENFWTISRLYYGSGRYMRALWSANRKTVPVMEDLQVGQMIVIPAPEDLDPSLIDPPNAQVASASSAGSSAKPAEASSDASRESVKKTAGFPKRSSKASSIDFVAENDDNTSRDEDFAPRGRSKSSGSPGVSRSRSRERDIDDGLDRVSNTGRKRNVDLPAHKIRKGETIRSIARDRLGDSHRADEILELNPSLADNPTNLVPGQVIELPEDAKPGRR